MNGKVAKRIRRAVERTMWGGSMGESRKAMKKRLRREYLALPYHRRKSTMYYIKTHAEANAHWHWTMGPPS